MAGRNPRGHPGPWLQLKISSAQVTSDRRMFIYLHLKTFSSGDTAVSPQEMCSSAYSIPIRKCFLMSDLDALCCNPRLLLLILSVGDKKKSLIPFSLPIFYVFDDLLEPELCQSHHTVLLTHCSDSTSKTASALLSENLCGICILEVRCTIFA